VDHGIQIIKISQLSKSKNQVNQQHVNNKLTTSQVVARSLRNRNLRIKSQVAEFQHRILRRLTVRLRGKLSKPSVPCQTEQVLTRRASGQSICGFKMRRPGEPSDYREVQTASKQHYQSHRGKTEQYLFYIVSSIFTYHLLHIKLIRIHINMTRIHINIPN